MTSPFKVEKRGCAIELAQTPKKKRFIAQEQIDKILEIFRLKVTNGKDEKWHKIKQEFLVTHINIKKASPFFQQLSKYPAILECIDGIREIYQNWNDQTTEEEINLIREKLEEYHQSLNRIIDGIQEYSPFCSESALIKQAELSLVIPKVEKFVLSLDLFNYKKSVIPIRSPEGEPQIFAYFKQGKTPFSGKMEKLIWDLANLFGIDDYFAATNFCEIRDTMKTIRGSCQLNLKGTLFEDLKVAERVSIDKKQIMVALLSAILFGFYDAHGKNIVVTAEGQIVFFDNTRSLPHGNGVIRWVGKNAQLSFFCSLLSLEKCRETLSRDDRNFLKKTASQFDQRFPEVNSYFEDKKLDLNHLREWLNPSLALKAMRERLNRMLAACCDENVTNLQEFTFFIFPEYKYFASLCYSYSVEKGSATVFERCGKKDHCFLEDLVMKSLIAGQNPLLIKSWCDVGHSLEDIFRKIGENPGKRYSENEKAQIIERILKEYQQHAVDEYKDCKRRPKMINKENKEPFPLTSPDTTPIKLSN